MVADWSQAGVCYTWHHNATLNLDVADWSQAGVCYTPVVFVNIEFAVADWSQAGVCYTPGSVTCDVRMCCDRMTSEELELSGSFFGRFANFSPENTHSFELFVGEGKDAHLSVWGDVAFNSLNMNISIFL